LMQGRRIIRHGYGYSEFLSGDCGLKTKLTVFVHERFNVKYSVLSIANPGSSRRELSIMYGVEWALGPVQRRHGIHAYPTEYGVCAMNLLDKDNDETAYITLINGEAEKCSDREAIFRRGWDADALTGDSSRSGASALRSEVSLAPGEEIRLVFALGEGGEDEIRQCLNEDTDAALDNVRTLWKRRLNGVEIHTPDAAMDAMMNGRLLYQAFAARVLAKCGYYQCGGAVGFRDQLQDMLAVMQTEPWRARQHILLCASKQFREGDVLHWWHWPSRGVRTRITDDRLFLPYVLWEYVHLTGDQSILTEQVSYLEGREIPGGAKDLYDDFADSSYTETLYQHCVRAVDSIGFGSYGLPLMGGGDWNDGMDEVGRDGGESVWLGWFLLDVLDKMCCLAEICRKKADGKRFAEKARKLRHCVEQAGWDGAWYRRAYYGSGEPLGAKGNVACEIDCISQAWAAICGGEHADEAVNSMLSMLYDDQEGMIKLLTPPFTGQSWQRPGYIEDYIPGVRENGGQYTHGAVWTVQACCKLGMGEKALALFDALNPINHALTRAQAAKYKGEPYAVAGDVYSGLNAGRAGWTWYTGAAAWLYKICLEDMLGIRREKDALRIAPTVPFEEYTVKYRYGEAVYILHLSGKSRGTVKLEDDKMAHEITL
ncbi:MAG: GH36-type glycosyl hydrolase domain-containing protein, partial [Christensenellales bacterium]